MKSIKFSIGDRSFVIANGFPTSVFLEQRFGRFHLQVLGLDQNEGGEGLINTWIDEPLDINEFIDFEVVDYTVSLVDTPAEKKENFLGSSQMTEEEVDDLYSQELQKFYSLEEYLKKERLI